MLDIVTEYINLVVRTEADLDDMAFEISKGNTEMGFAIGACVYGSAQLEGAFEKVMDYLNIPVPTIEECLNQYK